MEEYKKYLIQVRIGETDSSRVRIKEAANHVNETIKNLSNNTYTIAYTSPDGKFFGIVAAINKPAALIRAAIDGNWGADGMPVIHKEASKKTGLLNGDTVFVMECGNDFSQSGLGAMEAWLQHH